MKAHDEDIKIFHPKKTDGAGAEATFKAQGDLTMDKNGNFYVADGNNNLIRKVSPVK